MYEVFSTGAYAVVDEAVQVTTVNGLLPVAEMFQQVMLGKEIYLEEFLGSLSVPAWRRPWMQPAPHSAHFPERFLGAAMDRLELDTQPEVTIPRLLFAQSLWAMRRLGQERKSPLGMHVDNKTFPCVITVGPRTDPRCKVLAITKFIEPSPLSLLVEESPWYLVCDCLIIR
jgi:hypothetical protein